MKNLIYTTVATIALATAASADDQMTLKVDEALTKNGIYVDASALPAEVQAEIFGLGQSDDVQGERARMEQILADAGWTELEMSEDMNIWYVNAVEIEPVTNSLREHVDIKLAEFGYDVDESTLTDEEVARLFAIVQSTEGEPSRGAIEQIIQ